MLHSGELSPLEELGRRSFLGLMCPCRNPDTGTAERGFNPEELLRFVSSTAVSPSSWLGSVEDAARVVRLSAQVYAYRSYVSLCRTSPVNLGFRPEELLGFVRGTAISFGSGNVEGADGCEEVDQICSYRRFVSVRMDWVYQPSVEMEDSWMSEEHQGSPEEISDSPSLCEEAYEVTNEFEDDISTETQGQQSHEQMHDGRIKCVTNREDFSMQDGRIECMTNRKDLSLLDLDNEYESMLTTPEADEYCVGTAGEDEENLEMKNLHTDTSSEESEVDIDVECSGSFSPIRQVVQTIENGPEFLVNKNKLNNTYLSPCHASSDLLRKVPDLSGRQLSVQSEKDTACMKISETVSESNMLEQEDRITYLDHVIPMSSDNTLVEFTPYLGENLDHVIPLSSKNTLVKFTPCLGENFVKSLISKYLAHSCDDSDISASMNLLKHHDTEFESGANVSIMNSDDSDRSTGITIIPISASPKEASQGFVVEKHMIGQFVCPSVEDENDESYKVLIPSDDNCFPESSQSLGAQVLTGHTNETHSLNGMLNFDVECCAEDDGHFSSDDANQGGIVNNVSSSSSPTKTTYRINAKKRCGHHIASNNSNCIFTPYSKKACERLMTRQLSATHDETPTNDEGTVLSNRNHNREFCPVNDSSFLNTSDAGAIVNENLCSTLPESASKMTSHGKKRSSSLAVRKHASKSSSHKKEESTSQKKEGCSLHASNFPSWHRFYASPLVRNDSESPSLNHETNAESTINEETTVMDKPSSSNLSVRASKSTFHKNRGGYSSSSLNRHAGKSASYNGSRVYASPSTIHGPRPLKISKKFQVPDRFCNLPKSLHMKFPRNFTLPSKQELLKKFGVFGTLDHLRTKVSTFTGAAQVVFLHQTDAYAAYEYVKRKNIFGHANVRFWLDEHENRRNVVHDPSATRSSCLILKSCLKSPDGDKKEKRKVRFLVEDQPISGSAKVI